MKEKPDNRNEKHKLKAFLKKYYSPIKLKYTFSKKKQMIMKAQQIIEIELKH